MEWRRLNIEPPRRLRLELGLDCPLLCLHCSASAAPGHPLVMPPDLAYRLIDEFTQMGGEEVTFTGGEPLVQSCICELLRRSRADGLRTTIFTTGITSRHPPTTVAAHEWELLGAVLDKAVFSVYSAQPSVHDLITGLPGSLELTLEAIRRAVAAGIEADLHFVPTRANFRDLASIGDIAHRLGVTGIRVIRYVPQGRGVTNHDNLRLAPQQLAELRQLMQSAVERTDVNFRIGSGFGFLLDIAPPCSAALDELVIGATGRVYPCSGFSGFRGKEAIGTAANTSLADVWENAPFLRSIRTMLAARAEDDGCRPGGCLAQSAAAARRLTDTVPDPETLAFSILGDAA